MLLFGVVALLAAAASKQRTICFGPPFLPRVFGTPLSGAFLVGPHDPPLLIRSSRTPGRQISRRGLD